MARSDNDNAAIYKKMQLLQSEGMPKKQATAVAFRMYRDGEILIPQRQPSPRRNRKSKLAKRATAIAAMFAGTKRKK